MNKEIISKSKTKEWAKEHLQTCVYTEVPDSYKTGASARHEGYQVG